MVPFPFHKDHKASRGLTVWVLKRRRGLQAHPQDSPTQLPSYYKNYICIQKHVLKNFAFNITPNSFALTDVYRGRMFM